MMRRGRQQGEREGEIGLTLSFCGSATDNAEQRSVSMRHHTSRARKRIFGRRRPITERLTHTHGVGNREGLIGWQEMVVATSTTKGVGRNPPDMQLQGSRRGERGDGAEEVRTGDEGGWGWRSS